MNDRLIQARQGETEERRCVAALNRGRLNGLQEEIARQVGEAQDYAEAAGLSPQAFAADLVQSIAHTLGVAIEVKP